ncbi:CAP domain-containing protein [uncultured Hymenobacter sp.]|uniref:CAP domain-containing protein n=1 Tax=uncultured Hymenobacter sp. TaxID=170016 RepID=UPI0035CC76A3
MNYLVFLLVVFLVVPTKSVTPKALVPAASVINLRDLKTTVSLLQQLNMYRQQAGLPPLALSATACRAARLQAVYNLTHHTHGHYHPDYPTPRLRLAAVGHEFQKANGFLSYGYENCVRFRGMRSDKLTSIEAQILRAYRESPKHNSVLLDPHPTKVGIATIYDGNELQNSMVFCI